jgi:hypothetical protein
LDSDARFPASEVRAVERELQEIAAAFRKLPSEPMKIAYLRVAEAHTAAGSLCKCAHEIVDDPYSRLTTLVWSPDDIGPFQRQLQEIAAAYRELTLGGTAEAENGTSGDSMGAESLYDCFRDANGANLFERLLELCAVAIEHNQPIIFP